MYLYSQNLKEIGKYYKFKVEKLTIKIVERFEETACK